MSPKNNSTTADRFPMWPGSPVLRVLSVSLTSTRSSDPSHLVGLAGPASLRVNRMDLSCSRWFLWLHAGGTTPGSTSDRSRCRGLRFRLPLCGTGSATPITIDFGAIFIPAYNLPVYASQRPLPDAAQDSVRSCSLGFAAAVVSDGRLQRACKAQLPHHRTYGSRIRRFDRLSMVGVRLKLDPFTNVLPRTTLDPPFPVTRVIRLALEVP
jgi:hypothetical protein